MVEQLIRAAQSGPRRLVLAGGGHAHLGVLESWIANPPPNCETLLVSPEPCTAYSGMIPGVMAGHYPPGAQLIDLRPLAERAGIHLLLDRVVGLDAGGKQVSLASGQTLDFDLLSLATGGEADVSQLAGLGRWLIPVKPVNQFVERWPDVLAQAAQATQFHLVIVGGGAAGVELTLAAATALREAAPHARLTLITGLAGLLSGHGRSVQWQAERALRLRKIEMLVADATADGARLALSDGTSLTPDVVIAATGSRAPGWLAGCGLSLSESGHIEIGADLRSISHPNVFAAGDIIQRVDRPMNRSGVHAVKAGPILAANLRAALDGGMMTAYRPRKRTLYLLATGDRRAILSWGGLSFGGVAGGLIWRLKDWIDRAFLAKSRNMGR